jgi:hypothetical protein
MARVRPSRVRAAAGSGDNEHPSGPLDPHTPDIEPTAEPVLRRSVGASGSQMAAGDLAAGVLTE